MSHGKVMFTPVDVERTSHHLEEYSADLYAHIILLTDADTVTDLYFAVLSPLVLFKFLALMERDSVLPAPAEHPLSAERLLGLLDGLKVLSTYPSERQPLKQMLGVWSNLEPLLEKAWSPALIRLGDSDVVDSVQISRLDVRQT